ncbi:ATP/GTP-binding protein, putative, partial [Entamoeba invadens IP1]
RHSTTQTRQSHSGKEVRIIAGDGCSFKVLFGRVEWNGAQIATNTIYSIAQNMWVSLYAVDDCEMDVTNPSHYYIGSNSVVEEYYNLHTKINENRNSIKEIQGETAQNILITGSVRSGKGTFAMHLVNYAVREGYTPLVVDLNLKTNLITVPGCIGCSVVSSPITPNTLLDCNTEQPIVFCCGTTNAEEKYALFSHYAKVMSQLCAEKQKSHVGIAKSGTIVRCPFLTTEGLKEVVDCYNIDLIYVMDNEQLYNDIHTTQFSHPVGSFIVHKPAGVPLCTNYDAFVRRMQHRIVNNYMCGCCPEKPLCPRSNVILDDTYKLILIKSFKHENSGYLPIGQTQVQNPFDVEDVEINSDMKNNVLAVLNCDSMEDVLKNTTTVLGFVIFEDFIVLPGETGIEKKTIIRSPNPLEGLPSHFMCATGMKLEQDID